MKQITTLFYRNKKYYIVQDGSYFHAVDADYVGPDGKLTRSLNGIQTNVSNTLKQCILLTKMSIDTKHFTDAGMDTLEAVQQAAKLAGLL